MSTSRPMQPRDSFQDIGNYIGASIGMTARAVTRGHVAPDDRRIAELNRHLERAVTLAAHLRDYPQEP